MAAGNVSFPSDVESQNSRGAEKVASREVHDNAGCYVRLSGGKVDDINHQLEIRSINICITFRRVLLAAIYIAWLICAALFISFSLLVAKRANYKASDKQAGCDHPLSCIKNRSVVTSAEDTDRFLAVQRTAFHFQPKKNWMNDPNGPMFYKGYYHLFYQYNPDAAVWGNIAWAHSVSTDLIHWFHLNLALVPDKWYDAEGVWSGSATVLPDGTPLILYTGSSNESIQSQNMAVPKNLSDPFLTDWVKIPQNPLLLPPLVIGKKDFRDPTTAWVESDGMWRLAIGAKEGTSGVALVYRTSNFLDWTLQRNLLHKVDGTGMWECVDFYPVSLTGSYGLDTSKVQSNQLTKYVLKASLDDNKHDYYAIGTYLSNSQTFIPDDPTKDVGLGLRYDYGKYYASKTFYDPVQKRRILWGWVNESDNELDDIKKGWASVQTIPRTLVLDSLTGSTLLQWPIQELASLRGDEIIKQDIVLDGGALIKVDGASGDQLDIEVTFQYPDLQELNVEFDEREYKCSEGGAAQKGVFGPFGLLVLAADHLVEQTAVYFYLSPKSNGSWVTNVCSDQSRSSLAKEIEKTIYGTVIDKPTDMLLSLRVIVDHSIVETFIQHGIACITSRVYPTIAIDTDSHLFLFNNGSQSISIKTFKTWKMSRASV